MTERELLHGAVCERDKYCAGGPEREIWIMLSTKIAVIRFKSPSAAMIAHMMKTNHAPPYTLPIGLVMADIQLQATPMPLVSL